jgi:hypothetical protein
MRTINGSYAEYIHAPASSVALIESDLPWAELAAMPGNLCDSVDLPVPQFEIPKGRISHVAGGPEKPPSRMRARPSERGPHWTPGHLRGTGLLSTQEES